MKRREFLGGSAAVIAGAIVPGAANGGEAGLLTELARPQNLATPLEWFDRLITPNSVFFVRSHFGPPAIDAKRRLVVEGGARQLDLGPDELRRFKTVKVTAVLQCAGNGRGSQDPRVPGVQWTHGAMGQAEWTGVRLGDVLEKAGIPADAANVRIAGADTPPHPKVPRYVRGLPLARALDPSTLIAYRMNGEPLPHLHGAPFRLVVPGWTGNHWIKWLRAIRIQKEDVDGFFMEKGYRMPKAPIAPGTPLTPENSVPVTTLALRSLIAKPADGSRLPPGMIEIAGVAFSGEESIDRVEVSLDNGSSWTHAKLEGEPGAGRWQVFRHTIEGKAGARFHAIARAFDKKGNMQPEKPIWNPSGYLWNGWLRVTFEVAG
jgi:sulfite oxidase